MFELLCQKEHAMQFWILLFVALLYLLVIIICPGLLVLVCLCLIPFHNAFSKYITNRYATYPSTGVMWNYGDLTFWYAGANQSCANLVGLFVILIQLKLLTLTWKYTHLKWKFKYYRSPSSTFLMYLDHQRLICMVLKIVHYL